MNLTWQPDARKSENIEDRRRNPGKITIKVDGRDVLVDEGFNKLSQKDKDATIRDIRNAINNNGEPREKTSSIGALGRGALDMATFGFDDEIGARLKSMFTGSDYDTDVENFRQGKSQAQEDHPYMYGGGQVAGALPSMFIPGLNAARGATIGAQIGKGLLSGLLAGGAYGAGSGEGDVTERLPDALEGALLGGAVGTVAAPVTRTVGAALRGGGRVARAVGSRVAPGVVKTVARRDAERAVANAMREGAGSVDQAVDDAQKLGMPIGYGSAPMRQRTADTIIKAQGPEKQAAYDTLDRTLASKKQGIKAEARKATGAQNMNPYVWRDLYIKAVEEGADKEYAKVWARNPKAADRVQIVAKTLMGQSKNLRQLAKAKMPEGTNWDGPLSLEQAEVVRRSLKEMGGGNTPKAALAREHEKVLRTAMDAEHKDLMGVRQIWADKHSMEQAFERGTRSVSRDASQVEKEFLDTPNVAKPLWKKGVFADILHQVDDRTAESRALTRRLAETEGGGKILDMATGGKGDKLRRVIDQFDAAADVDEWARRGSKTSMRETNKLAGVRPVSFAAWALGNLFSGNPLSAVQHASAAMAFLPKTLGQMKPSVQKEVLSIMMREDPSTVGQAFRAFSDGSEAQKRVWARRFNNLFLQSVKGASLGQAEKVQ